MHVIWNVGDVHENLCLRTTYLARNGNCFLLLTIFVSPRCWKRRSSCTEVFYLWYTWQYQHPLKTYTKRKHKQDITQKRHHPKKLLLFLFTYAFDDCVLNLKLTSTWWRLSDYDNEIVSVVLTSGDLIPGTLQWPHNLWIVAHFLRQWS